MHKSDCRFWLEFDRVRVDYGDSDKFGDADVSEATRMLDSSTLQELIKKLHKYIKDMGGVSDSVEKLSEDSLQFDTGNLTIYATVRCSRENRFTEEDLAKALAD